MDSSPSEQRLHEEGIVTAFLVADARQRARELLWSKGRKKWTSKLGHFADLDRSAIVPIPLESQTPSKVVERLRRSGAPDLCWLVSERSDWDGRQMPLAEALEAVVGAGYGTIISCIPGRLGYFEGEMPRDRNLLQRRVSRARHTIAPVQALGGIVGAAGPH